MVPAAMESFETLMLSVMTAQSCRIERLRRGIKDGPYQLLNPLETRAAMNPRETLNQSYLGLLITSIYARRSQQTMFH
jgi:hypothetical protein